jgi:hypothetical protein
VVSGARLGYAARSARPERAPDPEGRPRMASILMGGLIAVPLVLLVSSMVSLRGKR